MVPSLLADLLFALWRDDGPGAATQAFHPGAQIRGLIPNQAVTATDLQLVLLSIRDQLGNPELAIPEAMVAGDRAWCLLTLSGCSERAERYSILTGQVAARLVADRIAEAQVHLDFLGFFGSLRLFPPDTFDLCLAGHEICR